MRSIVIFTVVTFLGNICYGQINLDKPPAGSFYIYDINTSGIRNLTPTNIVIETPNKTLDVFDTRNGIPELRPTYTIDYYQPSQIKVFEYNNGIRNLTPTIIIEKPCIDTPW